MKNINIPTLRFPGFSEDWALKKLDDITEKINSGKTPLGGESVYTEDGILFIRSQNVNDNSLSFENSTFISEEINNSMKNSIVKPLDILLNITGASLGRSCVVPMNFTIGNVNQHVCIIRTNKHHDPFFIQPILASENGQNLFESLQSGSGREGLNFQSIKNISLYFPTLPEQQKIATFLTTVNAKLQALKKKKTLLEQYKKGVMQKIFSRELSFKDENGNAFPEWTVKRLIEIAEVNPRTQKLPEKFIYIDLESVTNGVLLKEELIDFSNAPSRAQRLLKKRDVLFQTVRPYQMNNFFFDRNGYYVASTGYAQIRTNNNPMYIFQYLHLKSFVDKVLERCTGTSFPAISSTDLSNITISVPTLPEQTKIANFLSAIDEKITLCTNQIEKTEQYKKGLLQKLFV